MRNFLIGLAVFVVLVLLLAACGAAALSGSDSSGAAAQSTADAPAAQPTTQPGGLFANPPSWLPGQQAGEGQSAPGTGDPNLIVGGTPQPACQANPALQIQPLVENGQAVPNAFMGLDLNADEVNRGLRYNVSVPAETYVQYFEAWTGTTWEAVGPTTVVATAWTSWCQNGGWITSQGFPAGMHRQLNANNLPEAIGQWITK